MLSKSKTPLATIAAKNEPIYIKGARVHNLKNIDVSFPRNKFIVITGLSGSGKSSLAFDTLYAEGQRRYVESLSSYARQFIGRMDKPDVDYIKGISPAVAIEQKVNTRNPRSTVGTTTEIYDYLKLLFARIGKTISPISNTEVKRHSVDDVVAAIVNDQFNKAILHCPIYCTAENLKQQLESLLQKGFQRIMVGSEMVKIEELIAKKSALLPEVKTTKKAKASIVSETLLPYPGITLIIDRLTIANDDDTKSRLADSVQTAFNEALGTCYVTAFKPDGLTEDFTFSNRFEADGLNFEIPSLHLFSFNNPYGACKVCEGFGHVIGIDEDLVIPDKSLSVYEGAIMPWRSDKMQEWNHQLIKHAFKFDFPIHRPFYDLTAEEKQLLWDGNKYFKGIHSFFKDVEAQAYKIQYRVLLSRYRGRTMCPDCKGSRLRKDATYVKVGGLSITDIVFMPVKKVQAFFDQLQLSDYDATVGKRILIEIKNRVKFLMDVGLGYLTLNRLSNTLSGGESQRINLATSLGSSLVGSMYILDEPSIGLHPRDTERLISVLKSLRDVGNTLIVVEHDEEIMQAADQIIDIGPLAGINGGHLVAQGTLAQILQNKESLTARYLTGIEKIAIPGYRRAFAQAIKIEGARENNLKNVSVKIPLGVITCVTGVSGSGKTSLIKKVLYPALKKIHGGYGEATGLLDKLSGDYNNITAVEFVDQNPIGKSSRSNPVTYIKAYDEIRSLYADLPLARSRKYKPSHFSFNIEGGRCEMCEGEGMVTIEMQFMADIQMVCDTCKGRRFKDEILDVSYKGKTISDLLEATVDEAIDFFSAPIKSFSADGKIVAKLKPLQDVGLGYIKLGQSSSTLSGGEAQRIKLASFLQKGNAHDHTLFIFDEPTTGLHFHDINKLLKSFEALINQGNTIVIIEHNPEVIKCADWIIDMGPEGGDEGGNVVFEGRPEDLVKLTISHTATYLKEKLK
ncbi:MAG: hypothetical protein RIQ89_1077 [Bacteroidota bacterium]|jgi:excinuclease ABC subunit A